MLHGGGFVRLFGVVEVREPFAVLAWNPFAIDGRWRRLVRLVWLLRSLWKERLPVRRYGIECFV